MEYCPSESCTIKGGSLSRKQALLNIVFGTRICVKSVALETIFSRKTEDYTIVNSLSRCPETFYQCGYLNPTSYLCAKKSNLCPISSLKLLPKDTLFTKKYYSIDLEHDYRLFYSFEEISNYLVTTDIKMGFEDVCLDSMEMKIDGSKASPWEFWDTTYSDTCSSEFWNSSEGNKNFKDLRFKEIGKINWKQFYLDNKVETFLEDQGHGTLDFESQNYEISLFFRHALRFNR